MTLPNIIFYFSDQQRFDTMGCYGQPLPVTPVLDKIAEEGTLFRNAFTCQPVCGPARSCLQFGKYATQTGCFRNDIQMPHGMRSLADCFNDGGYQTAYVGKWHLASNRNEGIDNSISAVPAELRGGYKDYWMAADVLEFTSHGYDGYVFDKDGIRHDFIGYRADCINNYAINFVQNRDKDRPFFMFVSQIEPHHQNDRNRAEGPDGSKERFKNYTPPGDLANTEGDWRENYPDYLGQCNSLDYNVGRLIDTLKDQGIWDNTILIYTSDHGSHFRTRNAEYKRSCHESSIRVPMIAHGPGFNGGHDIEDLVSLIDIPATLLSLAGIKKPDDWQGESILDLVEGKRHSDEIFLQISERQIGRAIRTKKWKYSVCADGNPWNESGADVYYEEFLYDLENDPFEKNNLVNAREYAGLRKELSERLIYRMAEAKEKAPVILPCREN